MRCENCGGGAGWAQAFGRADLWRCRGCGGWSYRGPHAADPQDLYDEGYFNGREYTAYEASSASHERNFARKLALVLRHAPSPPAEIRLLELGCATGQFLGVARRAGISRAVGIELSSYGRELAARRGLTVLAPDAPETPARIAALRPNVVVAWDVWEHLERPATTFEAVLAAADPHVVVALSTVDAGSAVARLRRTRWRQFHPPTHLHYPTRDSLRTFLGSRDFVIRHHASFGYFRPLVEYVRGLGVESAASRAKRFPWTLPMYLNLWDIQLVIAERT
jgi:cyclopropane fatty-acyl-phospholipid synthase-like methyltransferase